MSNLQARIAEQFLKRISESEDIDPAMAAKLKELLLTQADKLKAEQLVQIFTSSEAKEIK
jgi:hypothetical protein